MQYSTVKLFMLAATLFSVLLHCQISGYLIWRSQQSLTMTFCTHMTEYNY